MYGWLYNTFGNNTFTIDDFRMTFPSSQPTKIIHDLIKLDFMKRVKRGKYQIVRPEEFVKRIVKENLEKGSFYTGPEIAIDFVNDLDFSSGQIIFDPACGSGAFLFNSNAPAEQIVGVDVDPIAIMIAKLNYFIKFPKAKSPNLFCDDFSIHCKQNLLKYMSLLLTLCAFPYANHDIF